MEESKALAIPSSRELTPTIWTMIRDMAPMMHKARLFNVSSEEQAAAIMLKGFELGLGFTASFELVQVVQGKPALSPRGALALLHTSPEITKIVITRLVDAAGKFSGYSCKMTRRNGFEFSSTWTMADAQKANLIKPDSGWMNYPENMCMWRAIGFAADVVAPDITAGMTGLMKMPEKFGVALNEGGDVIEATLVQDAPVEATTAPTTNAITLDDLLGMFGPDAVLTANGGVMPLDDAQVEACANKLAGGL